MVKYLIQNTWTVSIDLYSDQPPVELGRNIHYPQTIAGREMDESIPPTRRTQCVFRLTIACIVTLLDRKPDCTFKIYFVVPLQFPLVSGLVSTQVGSKFQL